MKKGFFQIGLIVIVASVFVAGLLVNKVKFSLPKADSCNSYDGDQKGCTSSCGGIKSDGVTSYKCKWLSATSHCVESVNTCSPNIPPTSGGCIPDHPVSSCEKINDVWNKCTTFVGDVGVSESACSGISASQTTNQCSSLGSSYYCISSGFCITNQYCNYKPKECKPDTSCGPIPPQSTPSPTPTATPTATPVRSCNSVCSNDSQCPSGMGCYKKFWSSTGYCRNMTCTKSENCLCPTPSPTPSPSSTPTITPSPSPTPVAKAYLRICKYKDENGNGYKDSEDSGISWSFKYEYDDAVHGVINDWWRVWDKACAKVEVPVGKNITVSEEGKSGWELTGIYADSAKQTGGNYIYNSESGKTKEVWFLNKVNPSATPVVGEPNGCNGTCGSNSNCQSALYCYKGYCRNPQNPESTSCNNPEVLSATAPPVLPKTGSNIYVNLLGMVTLGASGLFIYKKFKLI